MAAESLVPPNQLIGQEGVAAVSFALFGTLLLRRCLSTDGVYERALDYAPVPERLKLMPDTFVQHRVLAQNKARVRFDDNGMGKAVALNYGVTIEAIYQQFAVHALNLSDGIRPRLIEAELQAEQDLCFVNPAMRDIYAEARRLGRRVGVVADTHWSAGQVRALLAAVAPELPFDFVHTSAMPEVVKAGGLFAHSLKAEGLAPAQVVHVGFDADSVGADDHGIARLPYELPADVWESKYQREESAARLLAMSDRGFHWRLDGGLRLLRRVALAELKPARPHLAVGAAVLGPVMMGFQRLIEQRVAELAQPGRRVKVLFLARDGYLPMRVWSAANAGHAEYVEINRRIAMVAGSDGEGGFELVQRLFASMAFVNAEAMEQFFKIEPNEQSKAFFAGYDDGVAPGKDFAAAMPDLLGGEVIGRASSTLRAALLEYLRAKVDGFDACTDLVLVDIGYTGNIQRGLRRVFDVEGMAIRLHGIYLMPHGESFAELPGEDTVCGYFDDTVMTPAAKRGVVRDAPLIEEFCCAPVGSARGYVGGREVREEDVRIPEEITFCLEMQDECIRYHDAFRGVVQRYGFDPLADFQTYRIWTAAILSRFVMMPNGLECETFGPLLHDVSLGSRTLIATITTGDIRKLMGALPFPAVCSIHHPPVWLGGSLAAHAPVAGFAYAATGLGLGTDDFFRDVEVGSFEAMILKGERVVPVPASGALTPFGEVRLRIPVLNKDGDSLIALALKGPLSRGLIRSLILQEGEDIAAATTTRYGERQPLDKVQALRAVLDGNFFRATEPEAYLLLPVPSFKERIGVMTLLITPLFNE